MHEDPWIGSRTSSWRRWLSKHQSSRATCPASPEVVRPGETGVLIRPGSVDDLIQTCLVDPPRSGCAEANGRGRTSTRSRAIRRSSKWRGGRRRAIGAGVTSVGERARSTLHAPLIRDALTLVPAYLIPGFASLAAVPLLFRSLGAVGYGTWSLMYAISQGVPTLTTSWIEGATIRFGHNRAFGRSKITLSTALLASGIGGALIAGITDQRCDGPSPGRHRHLVRHGVGVRDHPCRLLGEPTLRSPILAHCLADRRRHRRGGHRRSGDERSRLVDHRPRGRFRVRSRRAASVTTVGRHDCDVVRPRTESPRAPGLCRSIPGPSARPLPARRRRPVHPLRLWTPRGARRLRGHVRDR